MARKVLSLELDGEVTLADLAVAIQTLQRIADQLGNRIAPTTPVRWVVQDLEAGSARAEAVGIADDEEVVDRIIQELEANAAASESRSAVDTGLQSLFDQLTAMVNGSITAIRVGGDERFQLRSSDPGDMPPLNSVPERTRDVGEVTGRVESMSVHGGAWFNLYDHLNGHRVKCTLTADLAASMDSAWKRLVTVTGIVTRDATGQAQSVAEVAEIVIHDEPEPSGWRRAISAIPPNPAHPSNGEVIDRFRDG